jgi:hypothetical protein
MMNNRLDGVLVRNRKRVVLDLALAAFFLCALLFSGFAFGAELPKLDVQARVPAAQTAAPASQTGSVDAYADPYADPYAQPAALVPVDGELAAR